MSGRDGLARRTYIEAAARPGINSRDIVETFTQPDGTTEQRIVLSFPPGTPVTSVPDALDAISRAYLAAPAPGWPS